MRKYISIAAVLVFVGGLGSYVIASRQAKEKRKVEPKRDVCVISLESQVDRSGNETFTAMTWQTHEPGNQSHWKIVSKPIGAAGTTEFSHTAEGSFVDNGKQKIKTNANLATEELEAKQDEMMRTPAEYLKSPEFAGTDEVAGFKVYKIRTKLDNDGHWMEQSYSPRVGGLPLRIIDHRADGSEYRMIAVKVEFK